MESSLKLELESFSGKNVLVTGHTGFKGSWLTIWLKLLGANVMGISLDPVTSPSLFTVTESQSGIDDLRIDIRDKNQIADKIQRFSPDFLFHLAAQSLVSESYELPIETWNTNLMGTINILESLKLLNSPCVAILITSDKCYKNIETNKGYTEESTLGGDDPYSASKAAAEIAINSYVKSFFPDTGNVRIASARAGNVIGGGDWSKNRIVPDCVKKWSAGEVVLLRNPEAVRPWQHVLEPLSGYLTLAMALSEQKNLHGESFNFGPSFENSFKVIELVSEVSKFWDQPGWLVDHRQINGMHEAKLLTLNCTKASSILNWRSNLDFNETVRYTSLWYKNFYLNPKSSRKFTESQIHEFTNSARNNGLEWAI